MLESILVTIRIVTELKFVLGVVPQGKIISSHPLPQSNLSCMKMSEKYLLFFMLLKTRFHIKRIKSFILV